MRRAGLFVLFWSVVLLGAIAALAPRSSASAPPLLGQRPATSASIPLVTCNYTRLSFTLQGLGTIDERRPFTVTAADTFQLFPPAPPITATSQSNGGVLLNNSFNGGVSEG